MRNSYRFLLAYFLFLMFSAEVYAAMCSNPAYYGTYQAFYDQPGGYFGTYYMDDCCACLDVSGFTENWESQQISIAGEYSSSYIKGNEAANNDNKVLSTITNSNRWVVNNINPACNGSSIEGPNQCYAVVPNTSTDPDISNGKLYIHGEHLVLEDGDGDGISDGDGDGTMLNSRAHISLVGKTGVAVETTMRIYCTDTTGDSMCFANVGLHAGEGNYRAIGFKFVAAEDDDMGYFNMLGPNGDVSLSGYPYATVPMDPSKEYTVKIQYSQISDGTWRWDYFLKETATSGDPAWIAGHPAVDDSSDPFGLGPGIFIDDKVRVNLTYGSVALNGSAAEGYYGPVKVTVW